MARKNTAQTVKPVQNIEKQAVTISKQPSHIALVPFLLISLYLLVHFIPNMGAIDVLGPHWLYIGLTDLLLTGYILANKTLYQQSLLALLRFPFTKLLMALFAWAGLSLFYAINQTEAWVCFVRMASTVIAFVNIAVLFYNRLSLFKLVAQLLSLILFIESIQYFIQLTSGISDVPLGQLINQLNANTGNKNIFAASLVIKVPFILYALYQAKTVERIFHLLVLTLGISAIFMASARASYVSLIVTSLAFILFCLMQYRKDKKLDQLIYRPAYLLIPIIAAFFIAQIVSTQAAMFQEGSNAGRYGSVTENLSSIALTNDASSYRFKLWEHALDYIKAHPFIGCGYGNWKLASIPFEKEYINDLNVPAHAHNDFLEHTAELGILGGLLYLGLYICLFFFTLKTWRSKASEEIKQVSLFSFFALIVYAVDAGLNFPIERGIMQVFFASITAFNVGAWLMAKQAATIQAETPSAKASILFPLYGLASMILLLPVAYTQYQTYVSLKGQMKVVPDLNNDPLKLPLDEVKNIFPSIPNLTSSSQPIIAILGRYYYENKQYDTALVLLRKSRAMNPYIYYSEFLTANIYYVTQQYDSAHKYATLAYYNRPRANTYYQTYIAVQAKRYDTAAIEKAFRTYIGYRNEAFAWNLYLMGMLNAQRMGSQRLLAMADSAIKRFKPAAGTEQTDLNYQNLLQRKKEILANTPGTGGNPLPSSTQDIARATAIYNEGVIAFGKGDYQTAAAKFSRAAAISPFSYSIYENAGVSYFNLKNYQKANQYFDKVIALKITTDGKSEFFKGVGLINLGDKTGGCAMLQIAKARNYPGAADLVSNYCK